VKPEVQFGRQKVLLTQLLQLYGHCWHMFGGRNMPTEFPDVGLVYAGEHVLQIPVPSHFEQFPAQATQLPLFKRPNPERHAVQTVLVEVALVV